MPPEQTATLRSAEKLLRTGKIAAAITEYTKAVRQAPQDWDTAILLASLHARNGDVPAAVEQYRGIASSLSNEKNHARAAGVLERILTLVPGDEDTLEQLADVSAAKGDIAAACSHLMRIAERRISRGELPRAIDALERAAKLDPVGSGAASKLFELCVQSGDVQRARAHVKTAGDCHTLAAILQQSGQEADARELLHQAYSLDPSDLTAPAILARTYLRERDLEQALAFLTPAVIGTDPAVCGATIDLFIHAGRVDTAMKLAARTISESQDGADRIAELACSMAGELPEPAFALADLSLTAWAGQHAWDSAIATLELFAAANPNFSPALVRLIEVAVDGDRMDVADRGQEMLAGAYLAEGNVTEALTIAHDLHERDPKNSRYDALLQRARQASKPSARQSLGSEDVVVPMRAAR